MVTLSYAFTHRNYTYDVTATQQAPYRSGRRSGGLQRVQSVLIEAFNKGARNHAELLRPNCYGVQPTLVILHGPNNDDRHLAVCLFVALSEASFSIFPGI